MKLSKASTARDLQRCLSIVLVTVLSNQHRNSNMNYSVSKKHDTLLFSITSRTIDRLSLRDAMRKRGIAVVVCPSDVLSVTPVYCIKTAKYIIKVSRPGSLDYPSF